MGPYSSWLSAGDNAWQMTAATLVGLMSIPALAVLYGGIVQRKWAVNTMMMVFSAFALTLIVWVLWAFKMGFGVPWIAQWRLQLRRQARHRGGFGRRAGPGQHPAAQWPDAEVQVPAGLAGLLPVRVRGDHARSCSSAA